MPSWSGKKAYILYCSLSYTRIVQTDMLVPEINFNFLFENVKLTSWKETEYNLHFLSRSRSDISDQFLGIKLILSILQIKPCKGWIYVSTFICKYFHKKFSLFYLNVFLTWLLQNWFWMNLVNKVKFFTLVGKKHYRK